MVPAGDVHDTSPLVLSLDSGKAMVCARKVQIDYALQPDGPVSRRVWLVAVQIVMCQERN